MTHREYRPVNNNLPEQQSEKTSSNLKEVWNAVNPKAYQCIKFNEFVVLRNDNTPPKTVITVKTPDEQKKQEKINSFPEHLKKHIQKLKNDLNLTQTHINKLKRDIESEKIQEMEINSQINYLKQRAAILRTYSDNKNFIKRFRNKYSSFNECLDYQLNDLEPETKKEVKNLLNDLKDRIDDVKKNII